MVVKEKITVCGSTPYYIYMEACKNAAYQSRLSIAVYMGRRPCAS